MGGKEQPGFQSTALGARHLFIWPPFHSAGPRHGLGGSSCRAWGQVCLEAQRVKVVSWEVPWTVKQAVRKREGLVAGTLLLGLQWLSPMEGYWGFQTWCPVPWGRGFHAALTILSIRWVSEVASTQPCCLPKMEMGCKYYFEIKRVRVGGEGQRDPDLGTVAFVCVFSLLGECGSLERGGECVPRAQPREVPRADCAL